MKFGQRLMTYRERALALFPAGSNGQTISVTHHYAKHGKYLISLFWTDPTGPGNSATMSISVKT